MNNAPLDEGSRAPIIRLLLKRGDVGGGELDAPTSADQFIDGWFAEASAALIDLADSARRALDVLEGHEPSEDDQLERIYRSSNILRAALDAVSDPQRKVGA